MDQPSLIELRQNYFDGDISRLIEAITSYAALQSNVSLSLDEISFVTIGVDKFIAATVGELRTLYLILDEDPNDPNNIDLNNRIAELKQELRVKCEKCDDILQNFIKVKQSNVGQFLLAKLRADVGFYCCQAAETVNSDIVRNTEQLYQFAWNLALKISPASTTTMSIAVNHSVFLMEVKNDRDAANHNVKEVLKILEKEKECEAVRCALSFLLHIYEALMQTDSDE